jgi:hypothetical protein
LFVAVADASDGLAHDLFLLLDDENDLAPDVTRGEQVFGFGGVR